jgi:cytochrome c553
MVRIAHPLAILLLATGLVAVPQETERDHAARMAKSRDVFKDHVRAIIAGRCLKCHGGEKVSSDFDLSTRKGLLAGGRKGVAVVPGDTGRSRLLKQLRHESDPFMPKKGAPLSDEKIARIAEWIALGAAYDKPLIDPKAAPNGKEVSDADRDFWSFRPLVRPTPPRAMAMADKGWVRTPIDRFIRARQQRKGIAPSRVADRRTLIRRAVFDLTGLPPSPDEVDQFVKDKDPDAYGKLIDRLLASPHFGERQARHWLDVARFAESHGFEQDYDRPHAYHYRDFVIKALNQDIPYDRFVQWQIAGDELAPDEPLAMMATGFLGAGVFPTQLTEKEFERARYDELDDMVSTLGTGMLGLTIGCARCHDHKFDPIPTSDYYRLLATFTTTIRSEIDVVLDPAADARAKIQYEREHATLVVARDRFEREQLPTKLERFLASRAKSKDPGWEILQVKSFVSTGGAGSERLRDSSLRITGKNARFDKYSIVVTTQSDSLTALRLEALPDAGLVRQGPGRASNGNFCLTDLKVTATPLIGGGDPVAVELVSAKASFEQKGLAVDRVIDDDKKSGWAIDPQFGKRHSAVFEFGKSVGFSGGTLLKITLDFQCNTRHNIGRLRISVTDAKRPVPINLGGPPRPITELMRLPAKRRTPKQTAMLLTWFRTENLELQELDRKVREHRVPKPRVARVMVCSEGYKPIKHHADGRGFPHFYKQTHHLRRGDSAQKGPVAKQEFLRVLTRAPEGVKHWRVPPQRGARTSHRRAALARWITDVEHGSGSLLARVIVNRLWQHHLGRGIVTTPNDFGAQGARPTHPELLDWLATELIRNGWRLKPIHKLIMTSAVYMQASDRDAPLAADVSDGLFCRQAPRRLEGEIIRDALLSVSGELEPTMFGKGTLNEASKRRSIYFMIKRSKLIPMMVTFDLPEPLVSQGRRSVTTVAPQALLLMNSPRVRGYAKSFATRIAATKDPVIAGYRFALARTPTDTERRRALAFLQQQAKSYREAGEADPRGLALVDFCQTLFGLSEFIYVD